MQTDNAASAPVFPLPRPVSLVYECPACHGQQPEGGRCGRCPGVTRPLTMPSENERLREALTYYAEGRIWDNGEIAREALADAEKQQ